MGGNGKAAGRACPAPTGCRKWVVDERGKGGRQPAPFAVGGGCPGMDGDARPVGTLQASSPKRGAFCGLSPKIIAAVKNCGGSGERPTQKWRKGRGR